METEELEKIVSDNFKKLGIVGVKKQNLMRLLDMIKAKHDKTYEHSLRVGILSVKVIEVLGINNYKGIFYPGLLHDYGKITVPDELLQKTIFNQEDREQMKVHVMNAYNLLKDIHPFSAWVLLWHHYYKPNDPYPTDKEIEKLPCKLSKSDKEKAKQYGLFLSMADVYDALITRPNPKLGRPLTPVEAMEPMIESFREHKDMIMKLYDAKIFGVPYDDVLQIDYKPLLKIDAGPEK
jgi:hypothetical protein